MAFLFAFLGANHPGRNPVSGFFFSRIFFFPHPYLVPLFSFSSGIEARNQRMASTRPSRVTQNISAGIPRADSPGGRTVCTVRHLERRALLRLHSCLYRRLRTIFWPDWPGRSAGSDDYSDDAAPGL